MKTIRIGNGCGFWGDNLDAPVLLAEHGRLDYLTLEYLAELTMSILALQKQRNPQAGFAGDFLTVLERLTPLLKAQPALKIVTNAGGMNPAACGATGRKRRTWPTSAIPSPRSTPAARCESPSRRAAAGRSTSRR